MSAMTGAPANNTVISSIHILMRMYFATSPSINPRLPAIENLFSIRTPMGYHFL
jgi:hypothetical protein